MLSVKLGEHYYRMIAPSEEIENLAGMLHRPERPIEDSNSWIFPSNAI